MESMDSDSVDSVVSVDLYGFNGFDDLYGFDDLFWIIMFFWLLRCFRLNGFSCVMDFWDPEEV